MAKNLKIVKIENKTKTKQKKKKKQQQQQKKKHTIVWNLKTIDPSNFELNQIEGAKVIY